MSWILNDVGKGRKGLLDKSHVPWTEVIEGLCMLYLARVEVHGERWEMGMKTEGRNTVKVPQSHARKFGVIVGQAF